MNTRFQKNEWLLGFHFEVFLEVQRIFLFKEETAVDILSLQPRKINEDAQLAFSPRTAHGALILIKKRIFSSTEDKESACSRFNWLKSLPSV